MSERQKMLATHVDDDLLVTWERIKAFHGFVNTADALRVLIRQEARRIEQLALADTTPPATP